ncbi:MAG: hypothetical protein NTV49_15540 [Kiritimatiellaeota bacterium]|nr:hypothetical protein [Kiritimatiellota bacterium]
MPSLATIGPAAVCRLDAAVRAAALARRAPPAAWLGVVTLLVAAAAVYGASFGLWRSPAQAASSAVKMPALLLSVATVSALANTWLAQSLGTRISLAQALFGMLLGFTIAAVLLAALSPVFFFLAVTLPGPLTPAAMTSYRCLLTLHTLAVGLAGTAGVSQLGRLLALLTGQPRAARRVLLVWLAVCALAGSELAWVVSPFLNRPGEPDMLLNPHAFTMNMYEYLWKLLVLRAWS